MAIGEIQPTKKWVVRGGREPLDIERLEEELHVPRLVGEILARRGLGDLTAVREFLSPSLDALHDPFLLPDMNKAVHRLWKAVDGGERLVVHGDYDVDGVSAVALIVTFFRSLGAEILHTLPNRLEEGYGLSERAIEEAREGGATVLITVDCGISGHEHVSAAASFGIDTIVTDHHQPSETLPPALAVVAPSRADAHYPSPGLAGVGVAYKLIEAMTKLRPDCGASPEDGLDLVALGTIADVVPLVGENRILAVHGLESLARSSRPGLKALKRVAEMRADAPVSSGHVAFRLAPRLNAAGRLGAAERAVDLLLTDDEDEAFQLARTLEDENFERRRKDQETLEEAIEQVEAEGIGDRRILILSSHTWHSGVIGIVASRLVQRYHRPAILVAFESGLGKGSGRSIEGFDIAQALDLCKDRLEAYGGHERAAGLTVGEEAFEEFRKQLESIAREQVTTEMIRPVLKVDGIVDLEDCTLELVEWFRMLHPYGEGNWEPVLASRCNELVGSPKTVGKGHLKFTVRQGAMVVNAIGFGMGERIAELQANPTIDLVFAVGADDWSGSPAVQLKVKDFRPSTKQ